MSKSSANGKRGWTQDNYVNCEFNPEVDSGILQDMRICPVCGKEFLPAVMNIYKVKLSNSKYKKGQHLCSYTCYQKANNNPNKRRTKFKNLEIE